MPAKPLTRVLIIAGSDSGGGAGIQGDIKTITCLGGYAATAITALTAQNTMGVFGIHAVPPEFVSQQIRLVLSDIGADAIKTGMLFSAEIIEETANTLARYKNIPLVIDPVMVAKGGAPLLSKEAMSALIERLMPMAAIITPNIPEAEFLAQMPITTAREIYIAAKRILELGPKAVLIKGAHLNDEPEIHNVLVSGPDAEEFILPRIFSNHTHGTGCTLASAIALGLGEKMKLRDAITRGQNYVAAAIQAAPGFGKGHGPLGHNFMIQP